MHGHHHPVTRHSARNVTGLVAVVAVLIVALGACVGRSESAPSRSVADGPGIVPTEPPAPATTTIPGPPRTSCTSVVHIGDSTSVGLTSTSYLPNPADRIDAQYARVGVTDFRPEISGARSIVEGLKGQVNARDTAKNLKSAGYEGCWVFALGTTDAADIAAGSTYDEVERVKRMMDVVGDDPVLWVNVKTLETKGHWKNAEMQKWDAGLVEAAKAYPNIHVYDWSSVVQDQWFSSDRIHYTSAGYAQRAKLIADALAAQIPAR